MLSLYNRDTVKFSLAIIGGFICALSLNRCGSTKTTDASRVRVTFWHGMGGPLGDALEQLVSDFERANPDVDLVLVSMANYSSLSQKLMAAVQVDDPPNIAQMYESWTAQFHNAGKLVVLDSLIRGPDGLGEEELADFYPAFIEDNTWDGRIVTLPFNKSLPVFFYNIEAVAAAGYSEFPRTWPGFRQMARRLSDPRQGKWGCAGLVNEGLFGTMLRQKGGDYFDSTGSRVAFNSRIGVEVAEFIADLVNRDSSVYYGAGYEPQNDFLAGKIACIQSTSVSWSFMKPNMRFRVGIAPLPVWDRPNVISFGTNIGMFRKGDPEQIRAGWRFIKWFTSPEQQARWAEMTFYVPVRRSSLAVESYARLVQETPGLAAALAQLEYVSFEPRTEVWFSGRKALGDAIEQIVRGGMPAREALDAAARIVSSRL